MEKVFIACPVRDTKGYAIDRWLESVKAIEWDNLEFVMIDNSDTDVLTKIIEKSLVDKGIASISAKEGTKDMTSQVVLMKDMMGREDNARLALSREEFRKMFLASDAKYWFSWECDIILPPDALKKLVNIMILNDVDVVNHNYPSRVDNTESGGLGCSLYKRLVLEKFAFDEGGGYGYCDEMEPDCYHGVDGWLITRVLRNGFKVIDLHNILDIQHLGE